MDMADVQALQQGIMDGRDGKTILDSVCYQLACVGRGDPYEKVCQALRATLEELFAVLAV